MYRQLVKVVEHAQNVGVFEPPIGLFTGIHRDAWTRIYNDLLVLDKANADNFEIIQSALFALSLDSVSLKDVDSIARKLLSWRFI